MYRYWLIAGAAALTVTSPAHADHAGPTGAGADGASLTVIGPDTLEPGAVSAGARFIYARPDVRSDDELATLAGDHVHAHDTDYTLNSAVGVAYGVTGNLTLSAELPYVRREGLRAAEHSHVHGGGAVNTAEELGDVDGVGDLTVLAKYKIFEREGKSFSLLGGIKAPTGSTSETSSDGERLETEHQPGTGSWDALIGAAFGKTFGPMTFSASVLHQATGEGAQDTELGDLTRVGIALSRRFASVEEPHHHHHDDGAAPHHHDAPRGAASWDVFVELFGEWEGRQAINGEKEEDSGARAVWLQPGARYNSAMGWSVAGAIGLPIWQEVRPSHPDNGYRLTVALGRAF